MGNWYRVVKTIKGHRYAYMQQTYREGSHVRTLNRYIGKEQDKEQGTVKPPRTTRPTLATILSKRRSGNCSLPLQAFQIFNSPGGSSSCREYRPLVLFQNCELGGDIPNVILPKLGGNMTLATRKRSADLCNELLFSVKLISKPVMIFPVKPFSPPVQWQSSWRTVL